MRSALGDAASDSRQGIEITAILERLPPATLVVIDTIDLLLTSDTADNIEHLLLRLSGRCPLVMPCREQEWTDLLGRDLLPIHRLGLLSADQIDGWVQVYLDAQDTASEEIRGMFLASVRKAARGEGRVLLGSPTRLAMVCSLYAAQGGIPAGLSVPQLYHDYWEHNVERDRRQRRRTLEAAAQQRAVMELASRIWQGSAANFTEYVDTEGLSKDAVEDLLSSGLLRPNGALPVGFFHQSFAEFAVARHLAVKATDVDAEILGAALAANSTARWAVARYLGWERMDPGQATRLAKALPETVEGVRVRLRMLAANTTHGALVAELRRLESEDERLLRSTFPALADVDVDPRTAETIVDPGPMRSVKPLCVDPAADLRRRRRRLFLAGEYAHQQGTAGASRSFRSGPRWWTGRRACRRLTGSRARGGASIARAAMARWSGVSVRC